jgi:hypothetical protein
VTSQGNSLPWYLSAQIDGLTNGTYQIEVKNQHKSLACRRLLMGDNDADAPRAWNTEYEAFYAAWIEQLFDHPVQEKLNSPSMEPLLRDTKRNFLHNSLGMKEDLALPANPDCADLPYFLRSYFAWKNNLPFSFRRCNRGSSQARPVCDAATIQTDFVKNNLSAAQFKVFSQKLMNAVQSGNLRTAADNDETDFYPVALQRELLWPGTIYADPDGHVLMLVKWIAQTATSQGRLLAVDAQPDNTVSRKRFWEGTFLFFNSPSAAPGFKTFRPFADNQTLLSNAQLADYSNEQETLTSEDFHIRMGKLINPNGLDAKQGYQAILTALVEQLEARVESVAMAEEYFRDGGGLIKMPDIARNEAIFESNGAWEDYATPSRDIRMLNAISVLLTFPDKIMRHPKMFNILAQAAPPLKTQILQLHQQLTREHKIHYIRSNGTPWELSVADILARKSRLEMGYNPNDCVEVRWGAKPGTEEYASCKRHAPNQQLKQMLTIQQWFRDSKRPAR